MATRGKMHEAAMARLAIFMIILRKGKVG